MLADLGVASRRACEAMIESGDVSVNGEPVTTLPAWVTPQDRIEVQGRLVHDPARSGGRKKPAAPTTLGELHARRPTPEARLVYVMLNKPRNTVSTASDPDGRRTVVDLVQHPAAARLFPVGRLDYDTTGLLLLTNDGDLTNLLTHPRYGVVKTYRAIVKGMLDDEALRQLEEGIYLADRREGRTEGASKAAHVGLTLVKRDRDRTVLEITLKEGRNRQVRRMFAAVGCPVRKLQRLRMGPLSLKGLAVGQWRELTRDELRKLRDEVGRRGADHQPQPEPAPGKRQRQGASRPGRAQRSRGA